MSKLTKRANLYGRTDPNYRKATLLKIKNKNYKKNIELLCHHKKSALFCNYPYSQLIVKIIKILAGHCENKHLHCVKIKVRILYSLFLTYNRILVQTRLLIRVIL